MTFLHPTLFAAGLACIAIPILVHLLLRQRRKPIQWAAMRFLMEAYRRQRRRLRIQQWLLLAARCLLLALLAFALGKPLLEKAGVLGGGRTIYLLIDNGLASSLREGEGSEGRIALERHKDRAKNLLRSLGAGDRAGLITLGRPAAGVVVPASADPSSVIRLIDEMQPTDAATDLAGALEQVRAAVASTDAERDRPVVVAVISDFLEGSADVSKPLPAALAEMASAQLLATEPRESAPGNIQIVAVEPLRPVILTGGSVGTGQREQVRISLRRAGTSITNSGVTSLRLRAVGADEPSRGPGSQQTVRWQPGQADVTVSMQIDPLAGEADGAAATALVAEIDRDALAGDNIFRRPVGVREALRIGIAARQRFGAVAGIDRLGPAEWLNLALAPSAGAPMDVSMIEPTALDTPTLANIDVLFIPAPDQVREGDWIKLKRFAEGGGLIIVSPAAEETVHLWSDVMVRELGLPWRIAREAIVFEGGIGLDERIADSSVLSLIAAELPALVKPVRVQRALPIEAGAASTEVLLKLADGTPWLVASEAGAAAEAPSSGSDSVRPEAPGAARGLVVYLASAPSLTWSDMPAKPLMVPLMQELARQGFGRSAGAWMSPAGSAVPAPIRSAKLRVIESSDTDGDAPREIAVARSGLSVEALRRGMLLKALDESDRLRGVVAVNADAAAGRTGVLDPAALRGWLAGSLGRTGEASAADAVVWLNEENAGAALARGPGGSPISLPLLAAAVLIAAFELFMARWFSHAVRDTPGRTIFAAPAAGGGAA